MKKFLLNITLFFRYFFYGMRAADDIISGADGKESNGGVTKENKVQSEKHKVCQDLLRGEITEEVKELRYEMYHSERKSREYEYAGGGRAKKRKSIFGYNGNAENEDGHKIVLVQENEEDTGGVYSDMDPNKVRSFLFQFKRDFVPTCLLEEWATKVVVKEYEGNDYILDFYFDIYPKQFNRRSRIFVNKLAEIVKGDLRTDLLDFETFSFMTKNAYGSDDMVKFEYKRKRYLEGKTYDGSFILSFFVTKVNERDTIEDVYHEETARKVAENAPRENNDATVDMMALINTDNYDNNTAESLINDMKNDRSGGEN